MNALVIMLLTLAFVTCLISASAPLPRLNFCNSIQPVTVAGQRYANHTLSRTKRDANLEVDVDEFDVGSFENLKLNQVIFWKEKFLSELNTIKAHMNQSRSILYLNY